ncbi:hypothetical protein F4678DRAFT_458206 [Xylaria arbuscula]|nr:hypothetical protein F4678DRAFT_458206 [Xylaria arbuscula]
MAILLLASLHAHYIHAAVREAALPSLPIPGEKSMAIPQPAFARGLSFAAASAVDSIHQATPRMLMTARASLARYPRQPTTAFLRNSASRPVATVIDGQAPLSVMDLPRYCYMAVLFVFDMLPPPLPSARLLHR